MKTLITTLLIFIINNLFAQKDPKTTEAWAPEPKVITPASRTGDAPSDAIVLFNGKDGSAWQQEKGGDVKWTIADNILTVKSGSGNIETKQKFGDCQLHIEWRTPA